MLSACLISGLTSLDLIGRDKTTQSDQTPAAQRRRINELQAVRCNRLSHYPTVYPAGEIKGEPDVWIELISPLEPVWLGSTQL